MRTLDVSLITQAVKQLCVEANAHLPADLEERLSASREAETDPLCREILGDLLANLHAADTLQVPICQDTGMAVVFAELGQDLHLVGGDFNAAVEEGVRQGYLEGRLRCSVVADPIRRGNTNDNTPPIIHLKLVPGDSLKLTVAPKGFGSENMSRLRMFNPSVTREEIIGFVAETVSLAGAKACPPVVVGVGIGGDFEFAALLAKQALCRPVSKPNSDPYYAKLEQDMLTAINRLGIGAQGFHGDVTALSVQISQFPTHIAGLPVAVNIGCHVTRHQTVIL